MRCFDGHPELWSIPHEWGTPFLSSFEGLDPWHALYDHKTEGRALNGFRQSKRKLSGELRSFPFDLEPAKMEQLFRDRLAESMPLVGVRGVVHRLGLDRFVHREQIEPRRVYDAFLTSYFESWTNYSNRGGQKRWVTGFTPRLFMSTKPVRAFSEIYPDGRMISLIRDPASWYASARIWSREWADMEAATAYWTRAATASVKWKRELKERMLIVSFDRIVNDAEKEMSRIASWLNIEYDDCLVQPTFNGEPIKPNSSYPVDSTGVIAEPAGRADLLTRSERARIDELTGTLYRQLVA